MKRIPTHDGIIILTDSEYGAALHRGKTITANRDSRRAKLAFRIAGLLTFLPYSRLPSLLVDRLVAYAEANR